jgi:hypothetical protein
MDTAEIIEKIDSLSTSNKAPPNFLQYTRDRRQDEDIQGKYGLYYYCGIPECTYRSDVASNFRRHLKTNHSLKLSAKSSTIHERSQEELESMFVNLGLESRIALETTVFTDHLQKNLCRAVLIHMIVRNRLSFSLVK